MVSQWGRNNASLFLFVGQQEKGISGAALFEAAIEYRKFASDYPDYNILSNDSSDESLDL